MLKKPAAGGARGGAGIARVAAGATKGAQRTTASRVSVPGAGRPRSTAMPKVVLDACASVPEPHVFAYAAR